MYIYVRPMCCKKQYTGWTFLWDLMMFTITGGLWLIWVVIRQLNRRSCRCCTGCYM